VQYLAKDQTATESFTVTIDDGEGGTVDQLITITITGTNDDPVISAAVDSGAVTEDVAVAAGDLSDSGTITFDDIDLADGHTVSVAADGGNTLGGVLTASVTDVATGAGDGTVTWNYSVANSAVQYLAKDQTATESFTVTIDDGEGGTVDQLITITITGTNDTPTLAAIAAPTPITEAVNASAQDIAPVNGTLSVTDVDVGDTLTAMLSGTPTVAWSGGALSAAQQTALTAALATGKLSFTNTPTSNGGAQTINWTWDPTAADLDFLAQGQTLTVTYGVKVNDGTADSNAQNLTFTITGTNDAATDLIFSFTGTPGNSLPNGAFGQMSVVDPDGGGAYSYSLAGLTATTLAGAAVSSTGAGGYGGDLSVSSTGAISASSLDDDRVYEMTVQVQQGTATYTETFSVITGTNSGVDTISGGYASGDDVIFARGGNDTILAGSGNDTVFGQQQNDTIYGGDGNDVLTGGGGNDNFVFDTTLNASTNVDRIEDFDAGGSDKIRLDDDIFAALGPVGSNTTLSAANFAANVGGDAAAGPGGSDDFILYDTATGNLYYDADGNGAGGKILFATLTLSGVSGTVDSTDFVVIP
jgi:VCBS repeat-containing protein